MIKRDIALGAMLTLLAIGYIVATVQIPTGLATSTEVGPRTFPYLVGGALLTVSVGFLVAQALRLRRRAAESSTTAGARQAGQPEEGQIAQEPSRQTHGAAGVDHETRRPWESYSHMVMFAAVAVYVLLLNAVGFLIPTALYIAAGTLIVSDSGSYRGARMVVPAAYGIAGSVVLYLLFDGALNVTLPQGILGI